MYWADKLAEEIIKRNPNKAEYVCAAGISPSGSVHIGNFRDVVTSFFVCKALIKKGRKAKLLFSWDEFDRMRKVPKNVQDFLKNDSFEKYLGYPYIDVPDPFGKADNYADYFEKEFMQSIQKFGIKMEYRYQAKEYRSGRYKEHILFALQKRKEIFDVLDKHRTQIATEEERENYYPVAIYCPKCHKDTTKINSLSADCKKATYSCQCGHSGQFDFTKDYNCKLQWKVDWPMRWMVEGVDFEPGGKDHASKDGSYDTAKDISSKIFGYPAPLFQGYEFIGIKGSVSVGKMSGSSGLNMTPEFLLKLYEPEVILWLYAKTEPLKAFDFCLSEDILRQYYEFDRMFASYDEGTATELTQCIIENCCIPDRKLAHVPMSQLVDLGAVVNFNADMMEKLFAKIGTPYKKIEFMERFEKAKFWLTTCSPESENKLMPCRNWEYYQTMTEKERQAVKLLKEYLQNTKYTLDSLQAELYAIPKQIYPEIVEDKNALKTVQGKFFKDIYNLILARDKGPRLYLYLFALERKNFIHLLDFSISMQEDSAYLQWQRKQKELEKVDEIVCEEKFVANPIDFKGLSSVEVFQTLDMRVCKILSAKVMKKSNKLVKLTVHDGKGERVIVSSIANDYTEEELTGKKVVVLLNLPPHKFGNEYSHGMVLAAVNEDGKSKLLFTTPDSEIGSCIH